MWALLANQGRTETTRHQVRGGINRRLSLEEVTVYAPDARPWLVSFWELFQRLAPRSRDFLMFELNDLQSLGAGPIKYQRSLKVLRALLLLAVRDVVLLWTVDGLEIETLKLLIGDIAWHSAKVTMISASVHAGEDAVAVSIQAHHKGPGLVKNILWLELPFRCRCSKGL